jgi:hypothetical protein
LAAATEQRAREANGLSTSPGRLAELACDKSPHVRCALAGNSATPLNVLRELLQDRVKAVRWEAVGLATPVKGLEPLLVQHEDPSVRALLALRVRDGRPQPPPVAGRPTGDSWQVQLVLEREARPNREPRISREAEEALAADEDPEVRSTVAKSTTRPELLAPHAGPALEGPGQLRRESGHHR